MDNVENATIRVDTATQKGSTIDVVRMVLGCSSGNAHTALRRLQVDCPELGLELTAACSQLRINGKGKPTPVADAKTLVEIVFLLPGRIARDFRRKSAAKVCRLLGGDMTLVSEIEQRRASLQSTEEGRATQAFLLSGSSGEPEVPKEIDYNGMPAGFRFLDTEDRKEVAKEVVHQTLKKRRCDDMIGTYKTLIDIGVHLDDRTKIEIRDNVSILTKRNLGIGGDNTSTEICVIQDSNTPTHTLGAGQRGHETGIVVVAAKMGVRVPPAMSGPVGKLMKTLYKKKYDLPTEWNDFPKRQTLFHGRAILENCYYERDEDIIEQAIRTKLGI